MRPFAPYRKRQDTLRGIGLKTEAVRAEAPTVPVTPRRTAPPPAVPAGARPDSPEALVALGSAVLFGAAVVTALIAGVTWRWALGQDTAQAMEAYRDAVTYETAPHRAQPMLDAPRIYLRETKQRKPGK